MRFNKNLIALGCLAAVSSAQAVALGDSGIVFYGNLYPQYQQVSRDPATSTAPTAALAAKTGRVGDQEWLNSVKSYLGVKTSRSFGDTKVGIDIQRIITQGCLVCESRNAFVSVANEHFGELQVGQFDTAYKNYGDHLTMLGISSSNFMSTSSFLSDVSWKTSGSSVLTVGGAKATNFHARLGNSIGYETKEFSNVQGILTYSKGDSGSDQTVLSMGVKWEKGPYYVSVQTETHNNFRTFATTGDSKDTATRLSLGYKAGAFAIAADFANLDYSQAIASGSAVNGYSTNSAQVSAQYTITPKWVVAANYATGASGSCTRADASVCLTSGLGGHGQNLGVRYNISKGMGVTLVTGKATFNPNAGSNSSSLAPLVKGGSTSNTAINIQYKF